jgi:fatty-acyl-CoA synthase
MFLIVWCLQGNINFNQEVSMAVKIIEKTTSAYSYPLLIKNLLSSSITQFPEREIVYRDIMRYTYKDFGTRIAKLANSLENLGIKQGDTVGVMDVDSHRYLECYFAIPMMGAVLHKIHIRLSPEQMLYTINHAEDDVILVHAMLLPMLEAVWDKVKTVKKVIVLSDNGEIPESPIKFENEYEAMVTGADSNYDFPDFDENAIATTFYTSGTTGNPKGVFFSHRQLVLHTFGLVTALCSYKTQVKIDSGDVYMPLTPMFHVHAWGVPYMMTMLGAKQVYPGRYEPEMILKLVLTEKVTFSHCVPTIIHLLVSSPVIKQVDLNGWKVIIGGSALSKWLCLSALKNNINLYTAYGMSETCPLLTIANLKQEMLELDLEDQVPIRTSTGLPVPLVNLKVVDEKGNEVPHDGVTTGEIIVRTPWLTQGYFKEPEKSEELWKGGWLHTGDIACINGEGYVKITDRLKDVIKTGGEWISSLTLEDIISQHEAISEVAVIGIADEKWGERPMAIVVLKNEFREKVGSEEIISFVQGFADKGVIPKYGVPHVIEITQEIAKTGVGKIDKKRLRVEYK